MTGPDGTHVKLISRHDWVNEMVNGKMKFKIFLLITLYEEDMGFL